MGVPGQNLFHPPQQLFEGMWFEQPLHGLQPGVQGEFPVGRNSGGHEDRQAQARGVDYVSNMFGSHDLHCGANIQPVPWGVPPPSEMPGELTAPARDGMSLNLSKED